jgi:3-hydroxybutyryl-CoA dehydrogenase
MSQTTISSVGIVGAGAMGHGIAQVCALTGFQVVLGDVTLEAARAGLEKVKKLLELAVEKGKVDPVARGTALGRIELTHDLSAFGRCDLVIEAVPEKLELKQQVIASLSALVRPEAILATNTSALSVSAIASTATHPERVVGLHFFNPVQVMKLLEVVRGEFTSDETVASVRAFGLTLRKELIVVKDQPGFASSRLGLALGLEAIRMLEEGVASAEDIDRAMEFGYGHPMGPLKLGDLVGLDVRLAVAQRIFQATGSATFRPPELLTKMVQAGKLGRKSGEGFYRYL